MKKRILSFVLTVAVLAGGLLIPAQDANAGCEAQVPLKKNVTIFLFPHVKYHGYSSYNIDPGKKYKGATEMTATSSKPSVVKVYNNSASGAKSTVYIEAKKTGKVKITVKFKKGGKWRKVKSTVKIVKYKSPFKSFKLGSKNIDKQLKKNKMNWYLYSYTKPSKQKLRIKLKKGWKIKKIQYKAGSKVKTIKNNSKIKVIDSYIVKVTVENKKKNIVQQYYFGTWGGETCPL